MKAKPTSSITVKKLVYFLDESIIFAVTVATVIFSEALLKALSTGVISASMQHVSWNKIIVASFVSIMIHGTTNNSFKYNDNDKPPMMKRIYQAVKEGVFWKTVVGVTPV